MWHYNNNPIPSIEDLPNSENAVGFVYVITNLINGRIYVGKKALFRSVKSKIGKREKAETKTRKIFKRTTKESDWQTYYGSSEELLTDVEKYGKEAFKREIVELCYSKKQLGFAEVKHQILMKVLFIDSYNGNILGRWYRRDFHEDKAA